MITLTPIDPNDAIANGPAVLNQNFDTIKTHIDDLENLLSPVNNSLRLTSIATIPANSIEAATLTLTGVTGLVLTVAPNAGPPSATLDSAGVMTVFKLLATGPGAANKSVLQQLQVQGLADFDAQANFLDLVNMTGPNSRQATKYRTLALVNGNMGGSATNPVDISKDNVIFLDYSAVSVTAGINLNLAGVVDGQEFLFILLKNAAGGTNALYNGTTGNEIFAYVDPATGFVTVSSLVEPQFTPAPAPNELSFMRVKYMNIGGGNFRLVVLEAKQTVGVA